MADHIFNHSRIGVVSIFFLRLGELIAI